MRALLVGTAASMIVTIGGCSGSEPGPDGLTSPQSDFIAGAGDIDGRLTGDRTAALRLADQVCAELAKGRSVEDVAGDAQRFTQGEGTISREQAVKLVEQAQEHVCP